MGRDGVSGMKRGVVGVACSWVLVVGVAAGAVPAQAQAPARAKSCAKGGVCTTGDRGPGGGTVFITPSTKGNRTGRYFEVAPRGWYGPEDDPQGLWCKADVDVAGATGTEVGTGLANTDAIIAVPECAVGTAAAVARAYAGGGLTDWFLPSVGELVRLKQAKVGTLSEAAGDLYWSSTQDQVPYAEACAFDCSVVGRYTMTVSRGKGSSERVRPVRAFAASSAPRSSPRATGIRP